MLRTILLPIQQTTVQWYFCFVLFYRFLFYSYFKEVKNDNTVNLLIPPNPSEELIKLIEKSMEIPRTLAVPSVYHLLFKVAFRDWNSARGKLQLLQVPQIGDADTHYVIQSLLKTPVR